MSVSDLRPQSLLFTINDLLVRASMINHNSNSSIDVSTDKDLTRLESGHETSFNEPFDLQETITDAVQLYR